MKFRRTNKVGKFEVKKVKNKGAVIDWLIDVFIWKPNRLGVPSYRESHVNGKGVPKSREFNIGMPQRRRQRVP